MECYGNRRNLTEVIPKVLDVENPSLRPIGSCTDHVLGSWRSCILDVGTKRANFSVTSAAIITGDSPGLTIYSAISQRLLTFPVKGLIGIALQPIVWMRWAWQADGNINLCLSCCAFSSAWRYIAVFHTVSGSLEVRWSKWALKYRLLGKTHSPWPLVNGQIELRPEYPSDSWVNTAGHCEGVCVDVYNGLSWYKCERGEALGRCIDQCVDLLYYL